jgi:hypothetical protein
MARRTAITSVSPLSCQSDLLLQKEIEVFRNYLGVVEPVIELLELVLEDVLLFDLSNREPLV